MNLNDAFGLWCFSELAVIYRRFDGEIGGFDVRRCWGGDSNANLIPLRDHETENASKQQYDSFYGVLTSQINIIFGGVCPLKCLVCRGHFEISLVCCVRMLY